MKECEIQPRMRLGQVPHIDLRTDDAAQEPTKTNAGDRASNEQHLLSRTISSGLSLDSVGMCVAELTWNCKHLRKSTTTSMFYDLLARGIE